MSLSYLLARASDSIADNHLIESPERLGLLSSFKTSLLNESWDSAFFLKIQNHLSSFPKGERDLMKSLEDIFTYWLKWEKEIRLLSLEVLENILSGQQEDIFRDRGDEKYTIQSFEDLERYCFLVAGSVGEFWAKWSFWQKEIKPREENLKLACNYGKGLQLLNILRDDIADRKKGRDYLSYLENQREDLFLFCEQWLNDGVLYARLYTCWRLRFVSLLPAFMGLILLKKLKNHQKLGIKISRFQVYRTIFKVAGYSFFSSFVKNKP